MGSGLTFRAPAARTMSTIWDMVVPRTMESSTSSTLRPSNTAGMAFSFLRTLSSRVLRSSCLQPPGKALDEATPWLASRALAVTP